MGTTRGELILQTGGGASCAGRVSGTRTHSIVVDVSGHGLGHLGQIAPVTQEIVARSPQARIIVRSRLATAVVRDFVGPNVVLDRPPPEATLVMRGPTDVDRDASAAAYWTLHARWDEHVDREAARLAALKPTILVADVPYLSIAAAKRIGIPALALCSLNWAGMYQTYCAEGPNAPAILAKLEATYRSADLFLMPQPHMPMSGFSNEREIGPVARLGQNRQEEIRMSLGIQRDQKLVLVSLGGIPTERRTRLPELPDVHWLVDKEHIVMGTGATDVNRLGMRFIDVLASSDAVVAKVGYCMFVEAACNGVGLISAPRNDWPESEPLIAWAQKNARFSLAEPGIDNAEGLSAALAKVLAESRKEPPIASGAAEAYDVIAELAGLS